MKHLPDHAQQPERPQSLDELRCRLNRRLSDLCEGWARCDHRLCKRWKQCCGEGPDFKCTDDGRPPRTFSPEETAKAMSDFYKEVKRRCAERAAGVEPPDEETLHKLRDEARAAERRRRESAQGGAAETAADARQAHGAESAAPVVEETQLAPEKVERINRASNDDEQSLPAAKDKAREQGPRITQL
jgi:hypothetical protein